MTEQITTTPAITSEQHLLENPGGADEGNGVIDLRDDPSGPFIPEAAQQTADVPRSQELDKHEANQSNSHSIVGEGGEGRSDDDILKKLLGIDYEYAVESGLLDIFYRSEEEGYNAALHILIGQAYKNSTIPEGFHHEPSALNSDTRVNYENLEGANQKKVKTAEQREWEPWKAPGITIDGVKKLRSVEKDGESVLVPGENSMYPNEYDSFAVLRTVQQAFSNQLPETRSEVGDKIMIQGEAPLIDGAAVMTIQFVLDAATGKIKTAYPIVKGRLIHPEGEVTISSVHKAEDGTFIPRTAKLPHEEVRRHLGLQ